MMDLASAGQAVGPLAATVGTFGLIFLGRAFLRAQAIAGALRLVGLLTIGLGIMATFGLVEINGEAFVALARRLVEGVAWAAKSGVW